MKTLAVTGIGSDLGSRLLRIVEDDPNVERVIGIDSKEPEFKGSKLKFHFHDNLERGYNVIFADAKADTAIYLKLSDTPGPDLFERNVTQFRHFIDAAAMARCKTVTILSSITGYGAHYDNLEVLYEGSLLKPTSEFGRASAEIEKLCYEYVHKFPTALLQILRAALIVGPQENNLITRALERSVMLVPSEAELAFQFVHVEDVARALHCMIDSECVGIFNLASDSALTIEQIAQLAERRLIRCPEPMLKFFMACGRLINMKKQPWFERDALEHAKHSILVANIKFRHEVYFDFLFTSPEAYIESLLDPISNDKSKTPTFAQELFEDDIETLDFLADMNPSPADEELEASLEKHISGAEPSTTDANTGSNSENTLPLPSAATTQGGADPIPESNTTPNAEPTPPATADSPTQDKAPVPPTAATTNETSAAESQEGSEETLPQNHNDAEKPAVN